jgi:iduronate 2-sulfatase
MREAITFSPFDSRIFVPPIDPPIRNVDWRWANAHPSITAGERNDSHRKSSSRVDALVEFVDIYPTLVVMAGLPAVPVCPATDKEAAATKLCTEGRALVTKTHALREEDDSGDRAAFSMWVGGEASGYTIRRGAYRYTGRTIDSLPILWISLPIVALSAPFLPLFACAEWVTPKSREGPPSSWEVVATELYNHTVDAQEGFNVADSLGSTAVIAKLSTALRSGWRNQTLAKELL